LCESDCDSHNVIETNYALKDEVVIPKWSKTWEAEWTKYVSLTANHMLLFSHLIPSLALLAHSCKLTPTITPHTHHQRTYC